MLEPKPVGTLGLVFGVEPPDLIWSSPVTVSDRAVAYLEKLAELPEKGPDRLAFFQDHLEDPDDTLARDAYDEFAVAPYADVKGLKEKMDPAKLLGWIENPKVQANRRRLYATMLGVCGGPDDAKRIERLLMGTDLGPDEAEARSGLDALIACYVALRGPEALDVVDRLFLERRGRDVPFAETYAAVMALRFLGEESDLVPRDRVLRSLRILLAEPKLADLVIADLARWQDWSVVDRLVTLFKEADERTIFVREPVVNYLRACPLPEAAAPPPGRLSRVPARPRGRTRPSRRPTTAPTAAPRAPPRWAPRPTTRRWRTGSRRCSATRRPPTTCPAPRPNPPSRRRPARRRRPGRRVGSGPCGPPSCSWSRCSPGSPCVPARRGRHSPSAPNLTHGNRPVRFPRPR